MIFDASGLQESYVPPIHRAQRMDGTMKPVRYFTVCGQSDTEPNVTFLDRPDSKMCGYCKDGVNAIREVSGDAGPTGDTKPARITP